MKAVKQILLFLILCTPHATPGRAQMNETRTGRVSSRQTYVVKSNLLYDTFTSLNLGGEARLGRQTTLDLSFNYNPWTFSENKKWKHLLVQPELRWWTEEAFAKHFLGVHTHYAYYNVGGLDIGSMDGFRYQGHLLGTGISYGYRWNLSPHWGMEGSIGVGYVWMKYDQYQCRTCGDYIGKGDYHYFGPTKIAISLIYNINL